MLDRAKAIDENFSSLIKQKTFPESRSIGLRTTLLPKELFMDLFESQLISRHIDLQARILKEKGIGFYTIGSSGHEGNAAIAAVFRHTDMSFLHYRSAAFMVQRSKKVTRIDPIREQLLSLAAAFEDPIANGRHKVFGSVPLYVPPQTSTIASHLPKAVGAALSIGRASDMGLSTPLSEDSVILCSFGDASLNHSTAQGAINAATWFAYQNIPLPLVFVCEDNGVGISVSTPKHWVRDIMQDRFPIRYIPANGLDLNDIYAAAQEAERYVREQQIPVFLHMHCVRLMGHAGSDIESHYWSQTKIEENEFHDPLLHSARIAIEADYISTNDLVDWYESIRKRVAKTAEEVADCPKLTSAKQIMASLVPPKSKKTVFSFPSEEQRQIIFKDHYTQLKNKRTLQQHLNYALTDILLRYPNTVLFGEDIGAKGGVYRVTADLQSRFGKQRVFDTLLDEQTILGTAIGLAHNGFLPIPEIQFLAYLHNAEDQLRGEAATLSFFSSGQYTNPMVIRIAGLAYQKGFGGHFHNDNSLAVLRDIPGIVVACPSNGPDAAKLLRECVRLAHEEQRVVVFIEPIALYMTKDLHQVGDQLWLFEYPEPQETISFGSVSTYGPEDGDLTIFTYGNGYYLSRQAVQILEQKHGCAVRIVDMHWITPLPAEAILREAQRAKKILIVDECRKTGSVSEEMITLLVESLVKLPVLKRITGKDCFIPLGEAWQYVLPSRDEIIETSLKLIGVKNKNRSNHVA